MKVIQSVLIAGLALSSPAFSQSAPSPDTSGNALLNGAYNFRQVSYYVTNPLGTLSKSTAVFGTITFDGAGNYSISGSKLDSTLNVTAGIAAPAPYTGTGTYAISASGQGVLSGPLSSSDLVYGLVSNGVFVGSSTQSNFNDLFIAAPATPTATVASLNGLYSLATFAFPGTDPTGAISAWFQFTADGKGGLGTINASGHIAGSATTLVTQSVPSVTYTFSSGVGTIDYPVAAERPTTPTLVSGNEILYISPDGKFIFGGSPTGWDMFIGVNTVVPAPSTSGFTGLYYQAGLDQDVSELASGTTTFAGYYGSLNTSKGLTIGHQHINSQPVSTPYDYTFADTYTTNSDGSISDSTLSATYILGLNGIRIGYDVGSALGINVAIPAATLSGTGVYLNPQGIVNAASYAPFTAGIAPGEMVSLFGTNLAATGVGATTIPLQTTLGNVQVLVNGTAAELVYVSPSLITFIAPDPLLTTTFTPTALQTEPSATIQVMNNNVASNIVSSYIRTTSPGVFTAPADGLGSAAVLHLTYSAVSTSSPAAEGETLALFLDGLGSVKCTVNPDSSQICATTSTIGVLVDGQPATVSYSGPAPGFVGLYQINFQVPAGIHSGDVYLSVAGPDSLTSEAQLSIAAGSGTIPPGS